MNEREIYREREVRYALASLACALTHLGRSDVSYDPFSATLTYGDGGAYWTSLLDGGFTCDRCQTEFERE